MGCNSCGSPTPRSLHCKRCSRIKRLETRLESSPDPDVLEYECTSCGEHYQTDGSDACPECGARRRRYAGEIAQEARS